ncbi:hypothetical protein B0T13DRAFT_65094 [Neurospora crassa]|nr:hypothetical protein B0T13DRAFT_65094 [Neurospora crassa]
MFQLTLVDETIKPVSPVLPRIKNITCFISNSGNSSSTVVTCFILSSFVSRCPIPLCSPHLGFIYSVATNPSLFFNILLHQISPASSGFMDGATSRCQPIQTLSKFWLSSFGLVTRIPYMNNTFCRLHVGCLSRASQRPIWRCPWNLKLQNCLASCIDRNLLFQTVPFCCYQTYLSFFSNLCELHINQHRSEKEASNSRIYL